MFTTTNYSQFPCVILDKRLFVFILLILSCSSILPTTLAITTETWNNGAGNLQWGTSGNWDPSGMPNTAHTALFTDLGLSSGDIIDLGGDRSVNGLRFDTTTNFTIGGGSGSITLGSGGLVRTSQSSGTQTIARPINIGAYPVSIAGTGELNLAGGGTKSGILSISSGATLGFTGGTYNLIGTTFSNSGTINFDGAAVAFISPTTIPGMVNFSRGTLSSTGTVTFSGPFNWTGGAMSGNGTTVTQGSYNYLSGNLLLDGRTLTNMSTEVFSPYFSPNYYTTTYLHGKNGAIFNNQAEKTVNLQGPTSFINDGGTAPTINNSGLFRAAPQTAGLIDIEFAMNNTGTVEVSGTGTVMNLSGGGTSSGKFNVISSAATLSFIGGTHNFVGSTFTNSGTINFDRTTVSFSSSTTIPGKVNLSQGTLSGTGTVTFTGLFNWIGGTMSGNGTTVTQGGVNYFLGDLFLDGRTLTNMGTTTFSYYSQSSSTTYLYGKNGAILNNQTGATVNLQGPTYFINDGGTAPTINNSGMFRATPQTGCLTDIEFAMNNTGTVQVSGTDTVMNLSGGGTSSGGFNVSSYSTLGFTGGTHNFIGSTFTNSGTINFDGATVSFSSPTTIPGKVNLNQGTLNNTGTVTFTGPFNWSGGTMSGNGTTVIQGTSNYLSGDLLLDGRTLTNKGMAVVSPYFSPYYYTTTHLYGKNGAIFNNQAGATVSLQGPTSFINDDGSAPEINNFGTFRATPETGTIDVGFAMNNIGTVEVQKRTLNLQGGVTQLVGNTLTGGIWKVLANSTLNITAGDNITINQADVSLTGLNSKFNKINTLADNQGNFSVLNGRSFTTIADLANSGTLTVGAGSDFSVTGDLSGDGNIVVSGLLTADAIFQDTVTIGAGGKVVIRPRATGSLAYNALRPVPELGTLVMLLLAAAGIVWYKIVRNR